MMNEKGKIQFQHGKEDEQISVIDFSDGKRSLFYDGNPISSISVENPDEITQKYVPIMLLSLLFTKSPKKVLYLGLGGAVLVRFFLKHFPDSHITVVESEKIVIDLAKEYFYLSDNEKLTIANQDVRNFFMDDSEENYDLIFVDLFDQKGMNSVVSEPAFFGICYDKLSPSGMISWNTWQKTADELMIKSVQSLCAYFKRNLLILPVAEMAEFVDEKGVAVRQVQEGGHNIFLCFKNPPKTTLTKLKKSADLLKVQTGFDFQTALQNVNYFQGYGEILQQLK